MEGVGVSRECRTMRTCRSWRLLVRCCASESAMFARESLYRTMSSKSSADMRMLQRKDALEQCLCRKKRHYALIQWTKHR